jgi:four helix bundle protein
VKSFEELEAGKRSHELTLQVYEVTKKFPQDERFGLIAQIRRAASSIPANIAEGFGRRTTRDFLRHLDIAGGSLEETRYFLRLAKDLNYLAAEPYAKIRAVCDESGRLLGGLMQALRNKVS